MKCTQGFTLIETVLVLALMALLVGFVANSFSKLNANEALDKNVDLVVSVLNEARTMTLSSINDARYGVHLDMTQAVLFSGDTYTPNTASNVETSLNALVGVRNISLSGGGSEVFFNRLTGATSQSGTFQIYLKNATTTYRTITVGATGIIERN